MQQPVNLLRQLKGHEWTCSSVEFHPAANMLASASWDRTIRVWDVNDGKVMVKKQTSEGRDTGHV